MQERRRSSLPWLKSSREGGCGMDVREERRRVAHCAACKVSYAAGQTRQSFPELGSIFLKMSLHQSPTEISEHHILRIIYGVFQQPVLIHMYIHISCCSEGPGQKMSRELSQLSENEIVCKSNLKTSIFVMVLHHNHRLHNQSGSVTCKTHLNRESLLANPRKALLIIL